MEQDLVDQIDVQVPPSGPGCQECLESGGWWVHLRRCGRCGHVGCCDSSPSRHGRQHWEETGHRPVRSYEPGESWWYDWLSGKTFLHGPEIAAPLSHPADQPAPGPEGKVPQDWQERIHR